MRPLAEFTNRITEQLAAGGVALGAALPDASDLLAKWSVDTGIDFLWIDLEHRSYGPYEVRWVPIICRAVGCAAMIRVPGLDPLWFKKALDIGANTIMVPQINTAEEARRAVEYAKYPPEGSRGISPLWTQFLDVSWHDYLPAANDETAVVVQIETPAGLENLDEIARVDGVDVVFAGPQDLAASLGHIGHPEHDEVQELLAGFPARVAEHGRPAGITDVGLEACTRWFDCGYRFINVGTIAHLGIDGLAAALTELRQRGK